MMPFSARRARQLALLIFLVVLIILVVTLVGVAQAGSSTPLEVTTLGDLSVTAPNITARAAIVVEAATGRVLYEKDSAAELPMASTTKIMTAILAIEKMELTTSLTVSQEAAGTNNPDMTWVQAGDTLTVEQLLYALMVASANQAGVVLAEGCSGSVEAFVSAMNGKAQELGLTGTHYTNPHGLQDPEHYSTAADLAKLPHSGRNVGIHYSDRGAR
jgi:D-alanyl-D-alanine carboxypeptidase (penicillin-binding protein 5/6)